MSHLGSRISALADGQLSVADTEKALAHVAPDAEVTYEGPLACIHPADRRAADEATRRALDPTGTGECRLVYRVVGSGDDQRVEILSCRYHYSRQ